MFAKSWTIKSPDKNILVEIIEKDSDQLPLYYQITYLNNSDIIQVLAPSPLGLQLQDGSFKDLSFVSEQQIDIEQSYTLLHGKQNACHFEAIQKTLLFENANKEKIEVVFCVSNDAVAFRYTLSGLHESPLTISKELTGFHIPTDSKAWVQPYDKPDAFTPAYEAYFQNGIEPNAKSEPECGWAFPALFSLHNDKMWVLLTEVNQDANYCGCHLDDADSSGIFQIRFPEPLEALGLGQAEPSACLPWTTPWRVVLIANSLKGIVESTIVTDLSAPQKLQDTSWVKPGRVSWSWWSDVLSPQDYSKLRRFVDLAAEMNWEYSLVDANWTIMKNGTIHDLIEYANTKGVGLMLWYNSGGPNNSVPETPRGLMNYRNVRRMEFERIQKWGIKAVKIDFFHSDKQCIIRQYHEIMEDAADFQIMVNFHGCTVPKGWRRTWPHMMSMEGVRGLENYIVDPLFPENAPWHNTILPFTRNVVGPMDYTPIGITENKYPHQTTWAHELATSVIFECGLQHYADKVEVFEALPDRAKTFLKNMPADWDQTVFVQGYPGKYVVLARRAGDTWYLGAINGQNETIDITIKCDFLSQNSYALTHITDQDTHSLATFAQKNIKADDALKTKLMPKGGAIYTFELMK